MMIINDLYLAHYGVKGMKWGVRRYQNYDGTLTDSARNRNKGLKRKQSLIKEQLDKDVSRKQLNTSFKEASSSLSLDKGSKVYHVTPIDFKSLKDGQDLFVSATDNDRNMYKSYLSLMMKRKGFGTDTSIKELEFSLAKDLKSPSNEDQKKIFESVYNSNKKIFDSELDSYYSSGATRPKDSYDAFIKTLDSRSSESKSIFYDAVKESGYNAVLDQHDVTGSWMYAERPLIVMDAVNTLANVKISDITTQDIEESLQKLGHI